MPAYTSRAQLRKPGDGEAQDVADINFNADRIDAFGLGAYICTSTTRPTGADRWDGLMVRETDTDAFGIWDAGATEWLMFDTRWQSYTPLLRFNNVQITTPGNGDFVGKYMRNGKNVALKTIYRLGSTTVYGAAGTLGLTYPTALPRDVSFSLGGAGGIVEPLGTFRAATGAGSTTPIHGQAVSSSAVDFLLLSTAAGLDAFLSNTNFAVVGNYFTANLNYATTG